MSRRPTTADASAEAVQAAPAALQPVTPRAQAAPSTVYPARCANCERTVQFDNSERDDSAIVEVLTSGSVTTFCPACLEIEVQWREMGICVGDRLPLALKVRETRELSPEEVRKMFGGGNDASSAT